MERHIRLCAGCAQPLRFDDVVLAVHDDAFHTRCLSPKLSSWDHLDRAMAPRTGA